MRVEVKSKVYPTSFLIFEGRKEDICWGERPEKEGRLVELVGYQNPGSDYLQEQERAREEGVKKMSGEARMPEEQ